MSKKKTKDQDLELPAEFLALCLRDHVQPATVLRGFIADLCGIVSYSSDPRPDSYSSNGSDERRLAQEYYARCGYEAMARWARERPRNYQPPETT